MWNAIEHVFELCPDGEEKVNANGVLVVASPEQVC
jgi:hypothetical protein